MRKIIFRGKWVDNGEWYFRGDRVSSADVMNYVTENYVVVEAEATVCGSDDRRKEWTEGGTVEWGEDRQNKG